MSDPLATTRHLGLPFIAAAQAQKHVTHNEALKRLDAIVQLAVLDASLAGPPSTPAEGDRYIVAEDATGGWADHDGEIAHFIDGAWEFAAAAVGWFFPVLALPGAIAGLVLGLVNSFKRTPSPALILLYGAAQGLFSGGISAIFEQLWNGVVIQAVIATLAVFAVTLVLFASGKVRASARATKVFLVALIGYALFGLVNLVVMLFGGFGQAATGGPFGIYSMHIPWLFNLPLGVVIGVVAVLLAAYSLVLDFDFIQNGVKNRAPRVMGWYGAFGLAVTLIWLYVEFLRLFAIIAGGSRN